MSVEDFFDLSLDNACIAGFDGYFKRVNPAWTRTLGWSEQELLSRPTIDFVHPDDREMTLAGRSRLREGQALGPLVNRYLCKDGSYRWFEWRSAAELHRGLVFASARDVTEQKLAEQQLREANAAREKLEQQLILAGRMAAVGTLAAGVAHEINNPLAQVSGNLGMLLEDVEAIVEHPTLEQVKSLKELLLEAEGGAERIRKIVRGLQTFCRAEDEQRGIIELQPLLEIAISATLNEIRHRARLVREFGETPLIEGDEGRLAQVFINLLMNAAQAVRESEQATNEIRLVTGTDANGNAVIEVRDNGPGVPADITERIFEPFFTTKPNMGSGLGLSICRNVVTRLGGELSLSSEHGKGAIFRVLLPPARTRLEQPTALPAARPPRTIACAAVLVVDDEPALGLVLQRVLRDHEVSVVTTAKAALQLLDAGKRFDVILSDLMMPEMSGMDFYDELARRFPAYLERLVFVTGGAFTPAGREFLERVPNACIRKPFEPRAIRELVQRVLSS
jgi:two-component system cell cycle sensor histidine kinase/response regulator CckA